MNIYPRRAKTRDAARDDEEEYFMDRIIITIGREFGSGGREFGRRLSEDLQIAYYDREIVTEIAKRTSLSEEYVHGIIEHKPYMPFPITTGRSFYPLTDPIVEQTLSVYNEQQNIIREMAEKSDCVIVGRCADRILKDMHPLRIFVYSDMPSRIARCRTKAPEHEHMSDSALRRHILKIDKERAKYYSFYTGRKWGDRTNYDLCINTSNITPKEAAAELALILAKKIAQKD